MTLPNRLNMDVFIPCLLFSVIYERAGVSGLFGNLALATSIVVLLSGVIALIVSKLFNINPKSLCPPIMFANGGNLGIPLIVLSFGDIALTAAVICFVIGNFFHITVGSYLLNKQSNILKVFSSPMILAVMLAMLLSFFEITVSNTLLEPIRMIGDICIPLMLFALGVRLIDMKLSEWKIGMLAAVLAPVKWSNHCAINTSVYRINKTRTGRTIFIRSIAASSNELHVC